MLKQTKILICGSRHPTRAMIDFDNWHKHFTECPVCKAKDSLSERFNSDYEASHRRWVECSDCDFYLSIGNFDEYIKDKVE